MEGDTVTVQDFLNRQAEVETPAATVVATPAEGQQQTPAADSTQTQQVEIPAADTTPAVEDITKTSFAVPDRFKTATTPDDGQQAPAAMDWREALKAVPKEELLKELGFDPFAVQLNEHIKKGGSAEDYLKAKAVDYTKVPDTILAKEALKAEYPTLSEDDIEEMYNDKYKQDDFATDDEKRRGAVYMKADAAKQRQRLIDEQQNFKLPEAPAAAQTSISAEEQAKQAAKLISDTITYLNTSDNNIKSLNESKSLAVSVGENVEPFKFEIDDPSVITRAIADVSFLSQILSDDKGVLDTRKAQEMVMFALNPENFKKSIVNYGKQLALREMVASGQNAGLPKTPTGDVKNETLQDAFRKARTVTLGSALGRG